MSVSNRERRLHFMQTTEWYLRKTHQCPKGGSLGMLLNRTSLLEIVERRWLSRVNPRLDGDGSRQWLLWQLCSCSCQCAVEHHVISTSTDTLLCWLLCNWCMRRAKPRFPRFNQWVEINTSDFLAFTSELRSKITTVYCIYLLFHCPPWFRAMAVSWF